jgi:hypothetical protein
MLRDILSNFSLETLVYQSFWIIPTTEIFHYTGHLLLFGCILIFDLRLLGAGSSISISKLNRLTVPFAACGFALAIVSGSILFLTGFEHFWGNPALVLKLIFMLLALVNLALFHFLLAPQIAGWDCGVPTPWFAKLSGALSLILWTAVISCGRLIAYY